ncbi:MAG: beta-galactosidase trimerization domain-containing protein [Bryobacteraceae bacterium]|nr:beta-galactosidase trimerization domain-containing protein [Bryobacteraceae bacterium]
MDRRQFLSGASAGLPLLGRAADSAPSSNEEGPRRWSDPRLLSLPSRPWRKVHLDFHNTEHVAKIGARFNADEFGDRLSAAHVNAIVVFAKDMHGYFYYPSRHGPVHPGLDFDLLGAQVKACRDRAIAVSAYYCCTWDHHLARTRPEWLVVNRDGGYNLPKPGQTPGWTALCLSHKPFVEMMLEHAREFVSQYELDGAWFDMPWPINGECFCPECLRYFAGRNQDAEDAGAQRSHKHALYKSFLSQVHDAVTSARPGCQVDFNEQGGYGMGERVAYMDNVDIEALPTAFWGYYYFPVNTRYARGFGLTVYGMTGRFKASWADFGGLKLPAQLQTELASIVANAARCDIGDQMPPSGRLDPAVYHVIGAAYGYIRQIEPYLEQAAPVSEAAIITAGLPFDKPSTDANSGLLKLLVESRIQFDIVEPGAEWERYGLVVLPDDHPVEESLAVRLRAFLAQGGAVIAIHRSGLLAGGDRTWLEPYGLQYAGPSPYKPAFMVPKEEFTEDIPPYEYALYQGASRWRAESPAEAMAMLGEPAFQRTAEHYTSHAQTPFERETEYAAVARSGKLAYFSFPLGASYFNEGYWVYRNAFQHALKAIHPVQLVQTSAPLSAEVTLTRQAAAEGRRDRYLVHVVNFSPVRSTPKHPVFYEDPIPLMDVIVRLNLPLNNVRARAVLGGYDLKPRLSSGGGIEVALPRVAIHEIVAFEQTG